jgi:probable addiction module antidote protein
MPKRSRRYEDSLVESLRDPAEAAAYLNAHLEDEEDDAEALFLLALRDVARAYGVAQLADNAELGRESLYKALRADGNPKLRTLKALLEAMGLKLAVQVKGRRAS